jgi:hypothetical protein
LWLLPLLLLPLCLQDKAEEFKATILGTAHWSVVQQAVQLCEPIIKLLRIADGDSPSVGKIHSRAYAVQQQLASAQQQLGVPAAVMQQVKKVWQDRWAFMDSPMHGAGYCLDPEHLSDEGLGLSNASDSSVQDLVTMIRRLLQQEERQAARLSYAAFRAGEGIFGSEDAVEDAPCMPAHQWWETYGGGHPELQKLAMLVLSQVSSACSCERAWSAYDFIHNKRRNRLTAARARDLVYVFTNGRLIEKMSNGEETFVDWEEEEEMEGGEE